RVASFKVPSIEELSHDYLWRVHKVVPSAGEMVIFNRSHYEDVLVVRVHELITPGVCRQRYDQINAFERLLAENGTTIL
ncbi:polyphosphate kinase, partial [Enterococcus faecium]